MSARFAPGDSIRVMAGDPPHHVRTPGYLKGRSGIVTRRVGAFRNPETLAHGGDGLPRQPLYRVRFSQETLWPAYDGRPSDSLEAEFYENWLETAP